MRQGSNNGRRPRGRPQRKQHGGGGGPQRHGNFDSSGPEGRIRGNASQVYEKYIGLARDATSAGDRIAAETYYQHAEHYYRIVNARTDPRPEGEGQPGAQPGAQPGRRGGNGQAEVVGEGAPQDAAVPPDSAALNGEQPQVAPQAEDRPAPQKRRRPRQAKPAEPQPVSKPDPQPEDQPEDQPSPEIQASPEVPTGKDGEPAET
jgi:hypothetical protein